MTFRDRGDAARHLAERLRHLRGHDPLVLAIPRGAVPMARVVADALDGDLDVVLVRKIPAPGNPALTIGAVDERGHVSPNEAAQRLGIGADEVARAARRELEILRDRRRGLAGHPFVDPAGRTVVVVDDGIATGSTMLAALRTLRRYAPARVIAAAAAASPDALRRVTIEADETVCLESTEHLASAGQAFDDFAPVTDDDVAEILRSFRASRRRREFTIRDGADEIHAESCVPPDARAVVVLANASSTGRRSPGNMVAAGALNRRGIATFAADLVTDDEDDDEFSCPRFDVDLLTRRLLAVADWVRTRPLTRNLPLGLRGANTAAAAALCVAAKLPDCVHAVVSHGGRPDLAMPVLAEVTAPTLLVVGSDDQGAIGLNQLAYGKLGTHVKRLDVIPGAGHRFEEPGALDLAAQSAARWFQAHLVHRAALAGSAH